jgi:hypothetical protein
MVGVSRHSGTFPTSAQVALSLFPNAPFGEVSSRYSS